MKKLLLFVLPALFLGCSTVRIQSPVSGEELRHPEEVLREARNIYQDAVKKYNKARYKTAREYFNQCLRLILSLPDEDDLPGELAERKSRLLSEVSSFQVRLNHIIYGFTPDVDQNEFVFPLIFNSRVEKWLEYYVTKGRGSFSLWLKRSGRYIPLIKAVFKEEGLPPDLAYVALVESGFNPRAYSPARAVGVWQFIKSTGKRYGLEANHWIDERRCPYRSTRAAARHLKVLYETFGSWELALAAYNCGSVRVKKAIKRAGTDDFWSLSLPRETENYIPKFIATLMIVREPEIYGFTTDFEEEQEYEEVVIKKCADLKVIARACGVPLEELSILNPELTRLCTPPEARDYVLKIPAGTKKKFEENFAKLPENEKYLSVREINQRKGEWIVYRVRYGDTLSHIARRFRTSVSNLKRWNPRARKRYIYPGQKLRIYRCAGKRRRRNWIYYKVRRGDTLSEIAHRFGTSIARLRHWNEKARRTYIYPGQVLRIPR